jgi:hypothetical protein
MVVALGFTNLEEQERSRSQHKGKESVRIVMKQNQTTIIRTFPSTCTNSSILPTGKAARYLAHMDSLDETKSVSLAALPASTVPNATAMYIFITMVIVVYGTAALGRSLWHELSSVSCT